MRPAAISGGGIVNGIAQKASVPETAARIPSTPTRPGNFWDQVPVLTIEDISRFVTEKEIQKSKSYLQQSAVGDIQCIFKYPDYQLYSHCRAGSKPNELYKQTLIISPSGSICSSICTCYVGKKAKCKHIAAALQTVRNLQLLALEDRGAFDAQQAVNFAFPPPSTLKSQLSTVNLEQTVAEAFAASQKSQDHSAAGTPSTPNAKDSTASDSSGFQQHTRFIVDFLRRPALATPTKSSPPSKKPIKLPMQRTPTATPAGSQQTPFAAPTAITPTKPPRTLITASPAPTRTPVTTPTPTSQVHPSPASATPYGSAPITPPDRIVRNDATTPPPAPRKRKASPPPQSPTQSPALKKRIEIPSSPERLYSLSRDQLHMEISYLRKQVALLQEENLLLKKNVMLQNLITDPQALLPREEVEHSAPLLQEPSADADDELLPKPPRTPPKRSAPTSLPDVDDDMLELPITPTGRGDAPAHAAAPASVDSSDESVPEPTGDEVADGIAMQKFLADHPGAYRPPHNNPAHRSEKDPKSLKEYLCRDCKMSFCRRGDRDNHEITKGHLAWKRGAQKALRFDLLPTPSPARAITSP